jgi:hypothetical protein
MAGIESIPSARRLVQSLRDMGYDFAQAVADVVDNSITAKATVIHIDITFDGDASWVRIADNGTGMTPAVLREAMRFGSNSRDYGEDDLGKFGLGLKTASLSQARYLAVASRWNKTRVEIHGYSWDIDHIARTDRWEIIALGKQGFSEEVRSPLKDHPGTVVVWRRLDRLLGYSHPYGESSRKRLLQMCREVENHLAMVFHRFLAGEAGRRKIRIFVNGNQVEPWDPFCRSESLTIPRPSKTLILDDDGVRGEVLVEPFILPPMDGFGSREAADRAGGPAKWNQQQGFYIYRASRLIQSGGWSYMRAVDEHLKLARVAVSFNPRLDEAFKVNVAKMRVLLPASLKQQMEEFLAPTIRLARETYDRKLTSPNTALTPRSAANPTSGVKPAPLRPREGPSSPEESRTAAGTTRLSLAEWSKLLLSHTEPSEVSVVRKILRRLKD